MLVGAYNLQAGVL